MLILLHFITLFEFFLLLRMRFNENDYLSHVTTNLSFALQKYILGSGLQSGGGEGANLPELSDVSDFTVSSSRPSLGLDQEELNKIESRVQSRILNPNANVQGSQYSFYKYIYFQLATFSRSNNLTFTTVVTGKHTEDERQAIEAAAVRHENNLQQQKSLAKRYCSICEAHTVEPGKEFCIGCSPDDNNDDQPNRVHRRKRRYLPLEMKKGKEGRPSCKRKLVCAITKLWVFGYILILRLYLTSYYHLLASKSKLKNIII